MNLDPRYILAPALEQFYINKKTGLPLVKGKITFYKDDQRTLAGLKPIYTLSGSPPNYSYVELPNPLTLSAVGTIQDDNGNNVLPFYFPYDEQGNLELYYVTVYSSDAVLQFTREGWPNINLDNSKNEGNIVNFIPNGQFLIHNNIPAKENKVAGEITQAITILAPGGWTFHRPEQSTAKDLVVFERFGSAVSNPTGYPRYAIRIENQLPSSGDLVKDLRIRFRNVNRFASKDHYYTFAFAAQTNTGNALGVTALVIKNFGQSGSPVEEKITNTVTLTSTYTLINIPFIFGENQNKTLGLNDDDSVAIALRFPTNSVFDVSLTDFILTQGNAQITDYPQITDSKVISQSVAGSLPIPRADGWDNYLPIVYAQTGFTFYDGDIGKVYAAMYPEPSVGELLQDGTRYLRSAYSQEGIPYARVAKKLWDESLGYYRSGNGITFVTANLDAQNKLILTTNQAGSATDASAGTTEFTVETVFEGKDYGLNTFLGKNAKQVLCQAKVIGRVTVPDAKKSGFTITDLRNSEAIKHLFLIECPDAKNLAGKYFYFNTTTTAYTLYCTVDGKGDDPKIKDRTSIKLSLLNTQTAEEVAIYLAEFLAGHQLTTIQCLEARKITSGSYLTFSTSTPETFRVIYHKEKQKLLNASFIGTSISDSKDADLEIPIDLLETDTAEQVAQKTKIAINQFYFAVWDMRDAFIRGWNKDNQIDTGDRFFSYGQGLIKNNLGSFQLDDITSHNHPALFGGQYVFGYPHPSEGAYSGGDNSLNFSPATGDQGGPESRPINFSANFVMKY